MAVCVLNRKNKKLLEGDRIQSMSVDASFLFTERLWVDACLHLRQIELLLIGRLWKPLMEVIGGFIRRFQTPARVVPISQSLPHFSLEGILLISFSLSFPSIYFFL